MKKIMGILVALSALRLYDTGFNMYQNNVKYNRKIELEQYYTKQIQDSLDALIETNKPETEKYIIHSIEKQKKMLPIVYKSLDTIVTSYKSDKSIDDAEAYRTIKILYRALERKENSKKKQHEPFTIMFLSALTLAYGISLTAHHSPE